jgi:D-arabinose 1-dehydrogenase-like Zn-dependent alcohol dehydrogenase
MTTQRGLRVREWGQDPDWEDFEIQSPAPGEALVRVEACGVGLTVLNVLRADPDDPYRSLPRVPGHELAGIVVETGSAADESLVGRRVVAYFYLFCGTCEECAAGLEDRCRNLAGLIGVAVDGGYAPFVTLPVRNLIPVAADLDPVAATVIPDAVSTPVHICSSRARVGPSDRVAVIGAGGGVGIHLIQVARLHGADVAGLDVSAAKLDAIASLGVLPVDSTDFSWLDPKLWAAGPPTVVVDFVGTPSSLAWALAAVERGGRVVTMTSFRNVRVEVAPWRLVEWEASLIGSRYATRAEVHEAARLVASGRVMPIVGVTTGPDEVGSIHRALRAGSLVGRGAIRWS